MALLWEVLNPIEILLETLLDDSVRFAEKAKKAGVEVELNVQKGMFHCFPLLAPMFPEATEAMNNSCNFIKKMFKIQNNIKNHE